MISSSYTVYSCCCCFSRLHTHYIHSFSAIYITKLKFRKRGCCSSCSLVMGSSTGSSICGKHFLKYSSNCWERHQFRGQFTVLLWWDQWHQNKRITVVWNTFIGGCCSLVSRYWYGLSCCCCYISWFFEMSADFEIISCFFSLSADYNLSNLVISWLIELVGALTFGQLRLKLRC